MQINNRNNYQSKRQTLRSQVYHLIKEAIISGYFRPLERLSEVEVSLKFKISRTPAREALILLSQEGLVEQLQSGGFIVGEFGKRDAIETCKLRKAIEFYVIEVAIKNITREEIKWLKKIVKKQKFLITHKGKSEEIEKSFMDFDQIIYQSCHSNLLNRILGVIYDRVYLYGVKALRNNKEVERLVQQHYELVKALEDKDLPGAKLIISKHMDLFMKEIVSVYTRQVKFVFPPLNKPNPKQNDL